MGEPLRRGVVGAIVAMLPILATGCTQPDTRNGPLQISGNDSVVTLEAAVNQRVVYGYNVVSNPGASAISNIVVSLIPEGDEQPSGVSFEPTVVVDIGANRMDYLGAGSWPMEEWATLARPLDGYELPPDPAGKVELLVVAKVDAAGHWVWPSTRIAYDYEGRHYVEEVTNGFSLCSPSPCVPRGPSD